MSKDMKMIEEYIDLVYENVYILMEAESLKNLPDADGLTEIRRKLGFSEPSLESFDTEAFRVNKDGSIHLYKSAEEVMALCNRWREEFVSDPSPEKAARFEAAVVVGSLVAETDSLWENNEAV